MTRRVVVCTVVFVALALSAVGWSEPTPAARVSDSSVTLTRPPGLAIDAALTVRPEILSGGWLEHRVAKARLGLAVLPGLSALVAAGPATLTRPLQAPRSTLRRRWSVTLRAPPALRLS
jgi:hypothetical protein